MYVDPGGEGGVIDGGNAVRKTAPCSATGGGGVPEQSSPGEMLESRVHAGVVSGRKGGRNWSSV